jgi:hypothetical protein
MGFFSNVTLKRKIWLSRGLINLGTDPSPLAQEDKRVENKLRHIWFIQRWNGGISVFTFFKNRYSTYTIEHSASSQTIIPHFIVSVNTRQGRN